MADRPDSVPPELTLLLQHGVSECERERAWTALVERHSRLLLTVARTVAAEHDGAMDAYTYVLERLREDDCRRLAGYVADGRSSFTTWLVVVARRLCVDHYRRRYGRAPRGEGDTGTAREERASRRRLLDLKSAEVDLTSIIDDDTPTPEAGLRLAQRNSALDSVLGTLDPADRLLIKLRFEDNLSAREIALVLQMPSAFHVYRRLAVVYTSLRRWLLARGVENSVP